MPKTPIDYSNSIIYKIICKNPKIKEVYIESTTNFTKRKYQHKNASKKYLPLNQKISNFIFENGECNNFDMIMIEKFPS